MKIRGDSIAKLERDLNALRETISQTETDRARQAELADQASAERRAAALDPTAFGEAARKAAEHVDERDRLGFVLERHASELARLEHELEHARSAEAQAALESAAKRQHAASGGVGSDLAAAIDKLPALLAARDEYDTAKARARELCPDDVDFELPANADEPEWPGVDRLVELVQAGSRRPLATSKAASERMDRERENAENGRIPPAVKDALNMGYFDRLRQLSPETLPAALAHAEQEARVRLDGHEDGPRKREIAEILERRLERVRELVADVEAA